MPNDPPESSAIALFRVEVSQCRATECSFLRLHELIDERGNFIRGRVEGEMTPIDNVDVSIGYISPVGFRLGGVKRCLVLAPNHQQARLFLTHPSLPAGIV